MNYSEETNYQRKVQHNIWKRGSKYRVDKKIGGQRFCQSFDRLKDARKFLESLNA